MKKADMKELMILSIYDEISSEERQMLDEYLKKHPGMMKDYSELLRLKTLLMDHTAQKTTDKLLSDARGQLRSALRSERSSVSFGARLSEALHDFLRPKMAWSGAGILTLGILIGYCSVTPFAENQGISIQRVGALTEEQPNTSITNVRFIDSDASDGDIEFEFDAVAPMRVKGNIDDPEIQKMLTHSLLNESNAGIRLSTVNVIGNQREQLKNTDPSIKMALLTSLRTDENPGVRREALRVLQQYDFDNDIRDVLLHVIAKDENSGIRVAAINALEFAKMDGNRIDEKTVKALQEQIQREENNYIRNRAVNLVKEIYQ